MKTRNHYILYAMGVVAFFASCKSYQIPQQGLKPMPESYGWKKDSSNVATLNWKQYFKDSLLVGLIDTALSQNLDLLVATQRVEEARADVRFTKGIMLPTINAYMAGGQSKYGLYTMDGAGNITTEITRGQIVPIHLPDYYIGLQTSWELDVWGKLRNKKKAALMQYLATIEGRNWAITNLVSEIGLTYYELVALDNQLDIIKETIALQQSAHDMVRVQKSVAAVNEMAVEQFEAQLLASQAMEVEVQQRMVENESRLKLLMGSYPKDIQRSKGLFQEEAPSEIQTGLPSDLLSNRPDIRQAEFELKASKADIKAAKAAFYPSFNINGAFGFQSFNAAFLISSPESIAYKLFGSLTAPLINRSAIEADFRTAKARQTEAYHNYQKSIITGYVEVYKEIANLRNLKKLQDLKAREVAVLSKSTITSTELFKTGKASYLEVLLAQKNAMTSKTQLIDVKKLQYGSLVNLYKALGGGWR